MTGRPQILRRDWKDPARKPRKYEGGIEVETNRMLVFEQNWHPVAEKSYDGQRPTWRTLRDSPLNYYEVRELVERGVLQTAQRMRSEDGRPGRIATLFARRVER